MAKKKIEPREMTDLETFVTRRMVNYTREMEIVTNAIRNVTRMAGKRIVRGMRVRMAGRDG